MANMVAFWPPADAGRLTLISHGARLNFHLQGATHVKNHSAASIESERLAAARICAAQPSQEPSLELDDRVGPGRWGLGPRRTAAIHGADARTGARALRPDHYLNRSPPLGRSSASPRAPARAASPPSPIIPRMPSRPTSSESTSACSSGASSSSVISRPASPSCAARAVNTIARGASTCRRGEPRPTPRPASTRRELRPAAGRRAICFATCTRPAWPAHTSCRWSRRSSTFRAGRRECVRTGREALRGTSRSGECRWGLAGGPDGIDARRSRRLRPARAVDQQNAVWYQDIAYSAGDS